MLDMSRNAVMNLDSLKRMIGYLEKMGYNTLMLYTEDTYEVNNQPYFGYLRGRYSKAELKELDAYATEHGIELIPCIQTLAHLNAIMRWPQYRAMADYGDALCAGDERVYQLLEDIFATLDECFTSRTVNIGMDEAFMVGLGRYLQKNGYQDRTQIFISHLNRVCEIGAKYHFTLCMWSDMFFRLVNGQGYSDQVEIDDHVKSLLPDNVRLIYWDYDKHDRAYFDAVIKTHQRISKDIWFAGGTYTWLGFAPHNSHSIDASETAVEACTTAGVKHLFMTLWGDDGGECSRFAALPVLFTVSEFANGNHNRELISSRFEQLFGISFEQFMLLELPGTANEGLCYPEKYMLYSDCFLGPWDCTVREGDAQSYAECAEKLAAVPNNTPFSLLFRTQQRLCEVLALKLELGLRTRKAYQSGDKNELRFLLASYDGVIDRMEVFYRAFEEQWMSENKPQGYDVQDIRIGGLIRRISHCKERLEAYLNGSLVQIAELEEALLEAYGRGAEYMPAPVISNSWANIVTANTGL